jgi:long-subunit acyl-CoA synthetase (AMP-forming)
MQFLGNGGRVGFAHYSPSNWLDHETTKKSESVQSSGLGSNDVEGLFRQVQRLQPTAMACPPNIWNGLYHLYHEEIKRLSSVELTAVRQQSQRSQQSQDEEVLATGNEQRHEGKVATTVDGTRNSTAHSVLDNSDSTSTITGYDIAALARSKIACMFGPRIKYLVTGGAPTVSNT